MEIFGLPLHPLVVHAVVVLVPLAALGGIAISLWTKLRLRYGSLVTLGAFGAAASTLVAQQAGESLADTMARKSPALDYHISIAGGLLVWTLVLFVGTVVVMAAQRLIDADNPRGRYALWAGIALTVLSAVVAVIQVARIGHAGSTAVWGSG